MNLYKCPWFFAAGFLRSQKKNATDLSSYKSNQTYPNIKREEFGSTRVGCPISLIPSEVGPAEDELGAAGGAGVVMDAGAMLAIATWREKLGLLAAC